MLQQERWASRAPLQDMLMDGCWQQTKDAAMSDAACGRWHWPVQPAAAKLVQALGDAGPAVPWQAPMAALLAVLVALLVDRLGRAASAAAPCCLYGQLLGMLGQGLRRARRWKRAYGRFVLAALAWCMLAAGAWQVYAALQWLLL
ncbi:hypothetical protein ACFODQ_03040, partial [Comamonas sp. JC664]